MDPISLALTRWVTLVSRLAALSLSLHRGYHGARNGVVGFASLCGTISRVLANLSRFGSSLELQDILLLWAFLRALRALRRFVRRLFGRLGLGLGFALPALPVWLRQLGAALAAPPALRSAASPFGLSSAPGAPPSFGLPSAPGARSALLSASSWPGYPAALPAWSWSSSAPTLAPSAYQPWPLAGGQRLALPPHLQRQGFPAGQPAGHRRPAPGSAQAEFLSGLSLALPTLPSVSSSAPLPGLPAPPAQLPWPGYPASAPPAAPSSSRLPAWSPAALGALSPALLSVPSSALPPGHLSGPAPRAPYAPMEAPLAPTPRSGAPVSARPSGAPSSFSASSGSASGASSLAPRPGAPSGAPAPAPSSPASSAPVSAPLSGAPLPVFGAPALAPPSAASLGAFTFVPPAGAPVLSSGGQRAPLAPMSSPFSGAAVLPAGVPAPVPPLFGHLVGRQGQIRGSKRGSDSRRRRRRR